MRHFCVPKIIPPEDLAVLDAPTANSEAVLVSLGGPLQRERHTTHDTQSMEGGGEVVLEKRRDEGMRRRGTLGRQQEEELLDFREREVKGVGQAETSITQ